jgi:DinB superfamily
MARPDADEYAPYYSKYVALVPEEKVLPVFKTTLSETLALLRDVSDQDASVLHPPFTWTIKQVIGHLTDTERVFGYRALRFARGDTTPLPGFDENLFARSSAFDRNSVPALTAELEMVRESHIAMFENLAREDWSRRGTANGNEITVRALAFIIAGHHRHHHAILRGRLDPAAQAPIR